MGLLARLAFSGESFVALVCPKASILSPKPMSSQYNHELRLKRASEHLQSIEAEVGRWREEHPYRTYVEFDAESRQKRIVAEVFRQPRAELGLLIGDCIHNLRSALDNLVYDLARANRSGPLSRSIARDSQFPIFTSEAKFLSKGMSQIRGVAPVVKTIIKGLQPYHRGDRKSAHRLWMLNSLANSDKHRLLPTAAAQTESAAGFILPSGSDIFDIRLHFGPVKTGTVLAEYTFTGPPGTEMDVYPHFLLGVGLRQGFPLPLLPEDIIKTMSVVQLLKWIGLYVERRVVSSLRPFLRHH